jgi:acetoin utilization deacetylase AcuC-like enzyme
MKLGIVYSPEIKKTNLAMCKRLEGFERTLEKFDLEFILPEIIGFDEKVLYDIHSREMIEKVKRFFAFSSTFKSIWAVYTASNIIQDYDVVIVPTSGTGHNATRERFRGYSFLNDVNLAIKTLKEVGFRRIGVIDTDMHHGEGVFEYIAYDPNTSYFCFCGAKSRSANGKKICVDFTDEEDYLKKVKDAFKMIESSKVEALIWYVGQDAHEGEFSELNLTTECFRKISSMVKSHGVRTIIILSGGTDDGVTESLSSAIIEPLLK